MGYRLLADLLVAIHTCYVAFVVGGLLLILVGWWRGWHWIRNIWFRIAHLTAIAIVAFEAICGIPCPLTVWEQELREMAGDQVSHGTFIGDMLHNLIFIEAPPWAFTIAYVAFTLIVAATFVFVPPRCRASHEPSTK